jgi:hypothetical protein
MIDVMMAPVEGRHVARIAMHIIGEGGLVKLVEVSVEYDAGSKELRVTHQPNLELVERSAP